MSKPNRVFWITEYKEDNKPYEMRAYNKDPRQVNPDIEQTRNVFHVIDHYAYDALLEQNKLLIEGLDLARKEILNLRSQGNWRTR